MNINHIDGKNKSNVKLYSLSTCGWCKKTKALLKKIGVAYDFIDVDLLSGNEKDKIYAELEKWNPIGSFPTIVINNDVCIAGFNEDKIIKELGK